MSLSTAADLLETLRSLTLLDAKQLAEASSLQTTFIDPRALAKELLQRGWLTPYQINQLFQGKGSGLALGPYILLERIGEGGMGEVFTARHTKMRRVVALKLIRKERLAKPDAIKRFHREVRASAALDHPNIVHAFDADEINGTHILVMEYVAGTDLSKLVKQSGPLAVSQACDYIRQAALGLQHAHERGLIHRDIKPHNLLLATKLPSPLAGEGPGVRGGTIKILDMGLARIDHITAEESSATLTESGAVMGTPDYIAPEQARHSHTVDIRADLYSLGCTLYYLLTAKVPHPGQMLGEKLIRHMSEEPEFPVEALRPEVPPGVAGVVRKLMMKRPEDRWQTPKEVAEVLACGLATGKWPAPPPLAALHAGAIQAAKPVAAPMAMPVPAGTPESSQTIPPAIPMQPPRKRRKLWLAAGSIGLALLLAAGFSLLRPSGTTPPTQPSTSLPPTERFDWQPKELVAVIGTHAWKEWGPVRRVAVSPNGKVVASAGANGVIQLWNIENGKEVVKIRHDGVQCIAFAPDGTTLLSGGRDKRLKLWNSSNGQNRWAVQTRPEGELTELAFSPDGKTIAGGIGPGKGKPFGGITIWDSATGKEQRFLDGHADTILGLKFTTDNQILISACREKTLKLWEVNTEKVRTVSTPHRHHQWSIALTPDAKIGVAMGQDRSGSNSMKLWTLPDAQPLWTSETVEAGERSIVAIAPDAKMIATGHENGIIRLWDASNGREQASLTGHTRKVTALDFTPNGKTLVSSGEDGTVRLWDTAGWKERTSTVKYGLGAWSPDGKTLALIAGNEVKLWDVATMKERATLKGHTNRVSSITYSAEGKQLITGSYDRTLKIWDPGQAKELKQLPRSHTLPIESVTISPDGKRLCSGSHVPDRGDVYEGELKLWDLSQRVELPTFREYKFRIFQVQFSPDGQQLVTRGADGRKLLNPSTGQQLSKVPGTDWGYIVFAPDGKTLAAADFRDDNGFIFIWDPAKNKELIRYKGHRGIVNSLCFTPSGNLLASTGQDGWLILWDPATGNKLKEWQFPGPINKVLFSPDGQHLATGNGNGTVYILKLPPELAVQGK